MGGSCCASRDEPDLDKYGPPKRSKPWKTENILVREQIEKLAQSIVSEDEIPASLLLNVSRDELNEIIPKLNLAMTSIYN